MSTVTAPYLFTEARLNIEPFSTGSTLHIPTEETSAFSPRKRARLDDDSELDEDAYSRKHIATESSIYFRSQTKAPRGFLWRILNDRKLLQIQCVDLIEPRKNTPESTFTFNLSFSSPIRPYGVAFADPEAVDALEVFVLTESNALHTFSLRKDLLLKKVLPSPTEFDPSSCFKTYTPSSFSFRYPYKLVATSSTELLVSLHDGGLLRLDRKAGDNGSQWRETFFSEGGWTSSFRGLIPWKGHNTIRFDKVDLEPGAVAAIDTSPDRDFVFTVSLDHTLKAWNSKTGKVGVHIDMLGGERKEPNTVAQYLINPSQGTLMAVAEAEGQPDGDLYTVITNSPKDHQFKFWAVRDADDPEYGIRDVQPDIKMIPPLDELMNTNVWQLAEFHVKPGKGWRGTQIWIRARTGAVCKIFTLTFDLLGSTDDLEDAWKNRWAAADEGSSSIERLVGCAQFPKDGSVNHPSLQTASITDQWIDFMFFPGRFSTPMLETALYIYRKGLNLMTKSRSAEATKPLKERLCNAVTTQVKVRRTSEGQADVERYNLDVAAQWNVFFGLVRHLYQKRTDSLALAFDAESGLCWSLRADQFAPIRACSEVEVYALNEDMFRADEDWLVNSLPLAEYLSDESSVSVARLFGAARIFRSNLPLNLVQVLRELAPIYALRDGGIPVETRSRKKTVPALQELYDRCGYGSEVSDEDFNLLTDAMQDLGGIGELENEIFLAALDRLSETQRGRDEDRSLARYGDKATMRTAHDVLSLGYEALLDLLSLVVFVSQDLEPDELAPGFRAAELYSLLITRLREYEVLLWLASHERPEAVTEHAEASSDTLHQRTDAERPPLTLLESVFIGDWTSIKMPKESLPSLLTYWSRAWAFGPSLDTQYEGVTTHIMSSLLKQENYHLAMDVIKFLPTNAWSTYLQARLYLVEGEYTYAATCFKQASEGLSEKSRTKVDALDTASYLDATQHEYFLAGAPRYFIHVASLFESAKLLSYAADFASQALTELEAENNEDLDSSMADIDRRKRDSQNSPTKDRMNLALREIALLRTSELKDEILSRLFNASLQTNRFEPAFSALIKFSNPAIRRASLQQLLQSLLNASDIQTLLALPFPSSLLPDVDATLLSLSHKHQSTTDTDSIYERILYAWRIAHLDYRGAAQVLHDRLERVKNTHTRAFEPDDDTLTDAYLMLINTLAVCGKEEGWILAEGKGKRRVITLEDVRRDYASELDRRSEMLQGRFAFDGMDVL